MSPFLLYISNLNSILWQLIKSVNVRSLLHLFLSAIGIPLFLDIPHFLSALLLLHHLSLHHLHQVIFLRADTMELAMLSWLSNGVELNHLFIATWYNVKLSPELLKSQVFSCFNVLDFSFLRNLNLNQPRYPISMINQPSIVFEPIYVQMQGDLIKLLLFLKQLVFNCL